MSENNNETAPVVDPKKTVIIEMEGGLIQNVINPNPDVEVVVIDYDVEGVPVDEVVVMAVAEREVECTLTSYGPTDAAESEDFVATVLDSLRRRYGG